MTFGCDGGSRRWRIAAVLGAVSVIGPVTAHAGDPAAARALFDEAKALVDKGAYEKACPKFEASLQMASGIGTRFNLADCWEHIGRTASAWAEYLGVAAAAKAAEQPERERIARERAVALEPTLSRLIIDVKTADPDIEVLKDGVPFARPSWGSAVPTDPGAHRIEARDRNKHVWALAVEVPKAKTVTVTIPQLDQSLASGRNPEPASAAANPPGTGSPASPVSGAPASGWSTEGAATANSTSDSPRDVRSSDPKRMAGYIVAGAGVVGLGVGVVLGLMTNHKDSQARDICAGTETNCPPEQAQEHASLLDEAKGLRTGAYIAAAVGGAALVTGAVLVLTSPRQSSSGALPHIAIAPTFGPGAVGGALRARW